MSLFDEIRRSWVKSTPEEKVRQMWLHHMVHRLHFPKELIAVEKSLKELPHLSCLPVPDRRLDVLCYANGIHPDHALYPLLLMECKRGEVDLRAANQVIGYNAFVKALFVAVVGKEQVCFGYFDSEKKKYVFEGRLPSYQELLTWIKPS